MKFRDLDSRTTENLAGGKAFKESPELQLTSLVLCSFLNDKYYESGKEQLKRLQEIIAAIPDKKFVAKTAIFARTKYGMRSTSHVLLGELACHVKGQPWLRKAISKGIIRVDDALEIAAYYLVQFKDNRYNKGLSAALRTGISDALRKFDAYQLAKYRCPKAAVSLVDLINLIHFKPSLEQQETYKALMSNDLKNTATWEAKLSAAGQQAESEEDKKELKAEAWKELLATKKIGYFALLRNLRNIIQQAPSEVNNAFLMLCDEKLIKKSLVFPFRFSTAANEIKQLPGAEAQLIVQGINRAAELSLGNVPRFPGRTLVALDVSGSMAGKPMEIGSLFAAALFKVNPNADLLIFDTQAKWVNVDKNTPLLSIADGLSKFNGGGTDFNQIFKADRPYDRILILSDMQGWVGGGAPTKSFAAYKAATKCDPYIYSFDLAGHGTLMFPENKIVCLAGFSEKVFDLIELVENKNALYDAINAIEI